MTSCSFFFSLHRDNQSSFSPSLIFIRVFAPVLLFLLLIHSLHCPWFTHWLSDTFDCCYERRCMIISRGHLYKRGIPKPRETTTKQRKQGSQKRDCWSRLWIPDQRLFRGEKSIVQRKSLASLSLWSLFFLSLSMNSSKKETASLFFFFWSLSLKLLTS